MSADLSWAIGLPYKRRGRDMSGVDCWGLVRLVYQRHLGIALPSMDTEYRHPDEPAVAALMARERDGGSWRPVETGTERPFDVLLLSRSGVPCHVGIVTQPGRMLHIEAQPGHAREESYQGWVWRDRVVGAFRWAG